ncbi:hypothetical protein DIPPA_35886 [Diplonema papillatum]|nr:hypothetical protein DIPPA_35886 [Diplonema papillatum]|eukprot:gene6659-10210_t
MPRAAAKKRNEKKPPVVERLNELLKCDNDQLLRTVGTSWRLGDGEVADLQKHIDILEAWTARMDRELVSGQHQAVHALAMVGMPLLSAFAGPAVLETNVPASFEKWCNKHVSCKETTGTAEGLAYADILSLLVELLQVTEIAEDMHLKVNDVLYRVLCSKTTSRVINAQRNAAECLLGATLALPGSSEKQNVDIEKILNVYGRTTDLPLKETLTCFLRSVLFSSRFAHLLSSSDKKTATEFFKKKILGGDAKLLASFMASAKSEMGYVNFALELNTRSRDMKLGTGLFNVLRCSEWSSAGAICKAADHKSALTESKCLHVYASPSYFTYQLPEEQSWQNVPYASIEDLRMPKEDGRVRVKVGLATGAVLSFTPAAETDEDVKDAQQWVTYVGKCADACDEESPTKSARASSLASRLHLADNDGDSTQMGKPASHPPPATKAPSEKPKEMQPTSGNQNSTKPAKRAFSPSTSPMNFAADDDLLNNTGAQKRPFPSGPSKLGASDLFDLESPSPRRFTSAKRAKQGDGSRIPRGGAVNEQPKLVFPVGVKTTVRPSGGKWEPPETLLLGKAWLEEGDSSDEEDAELELEQMQRAVCESMGDKKEEAAQAEINAVVIDVQAAVDACKKNEFDNPRETLCAQLDSLKEQVRMEEEALPETKAKEKQLTRDVKALHVKFIQQARVAKKEYGDLRADLDDVSPAAHELSEQILSNIDTMVSRGFEVLQKKWKKKQDKSEAAFKMFNVITTQFAAGTGMQRV